MSATQGGGFTVISGDLPFDLKQNQKGNKLFRVFPEKVHGNFSDEWFQRAVGKNDSPGAATTPDLAIAVAVEQTTFDKHLKGFCHKSLWPILHSMLSEVNFDQECWAAYEEVNIKVAENVVNSLQASPKDEREPIVWLQDYQLMLAANAIRLMANEQNFRLKIGFSLFTPFPSWDIFCSLPWAEQILQGLLACDVLSFQSEDYSSNFLNCCRRKLGCRFDEQRGLIEHGSHTCSIYASEVGIPFDSLKNISASTTVEELYKDQNLILSAEKLDYTKGLIYKLKSFEAFLEEYPEQKGKVTFLYVVFYDDMDATEHKNLLNEINQTINKINDKFSRSGWLPIKFVGGLIPQAQLISYYKKASVGLMTPLRDGLNLAAKEFVACQPEQFPGVLIISPFSGVAETMPEALVCNPFDIKETADAINKALSMPEDERTVRMTFLRRRVGQSDISSWYKSFIDKVLAANINPATPLSLPAVTLSDFDDYLTQFMGGIKKLALLLDYDGTLAPIVPHPDQAKLPVETRQVLESLATMPQLFIALISGRNVYNLKSMVAIEGLTYAGNHGLEILHPNGEKYVHHMPEEFEKRANILIKKLEDQVCRAGAWVEKKGALMTFHYRETPADMRPEIIAKARSLILEAGFKANQAHCAIEAKPPVQWNKGRAAMYILCKEFGTDLAERIRIIFAGDDTTDEDAMEVLRGMAATFRITQPQIIRSFAQRRLPNTVAVQTLLKWIEHHFKNS